MKQKVKLGYHVTIIKDAIAAFSHAFAHTILTTKQLPGLLPGEQRGKSKVE
ncbi:MAG TPA: hypothetical protein VE076_12930 [Nitrososphaeraceae archaeon]|nr:hypothetical protein [Nitrososphaeraceae archaeon]